MQDKGLDGILLFLVRILLVLLCCFFSFGTRLGQVVVSLP
jgi:hypothetical protein